MTIRATLLRHLRRVVAPCALTAVPDARLLERFVSQRDEDAFTALVRRHGPMVLRVCRRVLADPGLADDACQAVFLVLARRAASIRPHDALAAWLHGVAHRVALQARAASVRRQAREIPLADLAPPDRHPDPLAELTSRELLTVLDEEVRRLPQVHRLPIILCCLEGCTQEEAASQLGWTTGSVRGRLERGRKRLHARLVRRGLTLSAALATLEVSHGITAGMATLPAAMTARAALAFATGREAAGAASARGVLLAEGALQLMAGARLKIALLVLLVAGLAAAATGVLTQSVPAVKSPTGQEEAQPKDPARNQADREPSARTDRYGDPLPPGALARLGSIRFRHGQQILSFAMSPDGKLLATGGNSGRVCLWDAATGRPEGTLHGPDGHVHALRFSPDGKWLGAAGSVDFSSTKGQAIVWDIATRKPLFTQQLAQTGACLTFSHDGTTLVLGCHYEGLHTWDVATGEEKPRLQGKFPQGVAATAFSPDGRVLATGGWDKAVRLWDWQTGKEVGQLDAGTSVRAIAFAPDGKSLLTGQDGPIFVRLWDLAERKPLREFKGHKAWAGGAFPGMTFSVAFSPDGRTVASGADDGAVLLWDADSGESRGQYRNTQGSVHGVAFFPDGKKLAAGSTLMRVQLYDLVANKEILPADEHTAGLADMALSPDGKLLATAAADETIRLWDLATGCPVRVLQGQRKGVYTVQFSADGRTLASGGGDGTIRLWDVASGQERQLSESHGSGSRTAFAAGKALASGGDDTLVRLWDSATGKKRGDLKGHAGYISGMAVSPDGKWLATTGDSFGDAAGLHEDKTIRLWDLARQTEHGCITRGYYYSGSLQFTPDNRTLVYSDHGTLHFVDVATGGESTPFPVNGVTELSFAAGGRWLVTAGTDQPIRFLEMATGLELHRIAPPESGVHKLVMTPQDKNLLTLNNDGTVLVWDRAPPGGGRRPGTEAADLDGLWSDLVSEDGPKAYRAMWALSAQPERALTGLRARLKAALGKVTTQTSRVSSLIMDLDSDSFARRDTASRELEKLGPAAEPALRLALARQPSAEVRKRIEVIRSKAGLLHSGEMLRVVRVLGALEQTRSDAAQQVLEEVAKGAPDDWLTLQAKEALDRLAKQNMVQP